MSTQTPSVLFDAPGPKTRRNQAIAGTLLTLLTAGFGVWVLWQFQRKGEFTAEKWNPFLLADEWSEYLLPGLLQTLKAAVVAIILAMVFGFVFGMGRLSHIAPVRWVSSAVVEFFRSVPVLVMMYAFFQVFTHNGMFPEQEGFTAVVLALMLYNGAVVAELIRSGVENLPTGQREAGLSIGLSAPQTLRTILLPQALTAMLPSLVGQLVVVLKDTALGYAITYPELLNAATTAASWKSNVMQQLVVVALIFIAINFTLTTLAGRLEQRLRRRGHTAGLKPSAQQEKPAVVIAAADADAKLSGHGRVH